MINLRFPTENDIPQIEYVGNQKWTLDFGFIHYWESKLNKDPQELISFLPQMQKGGIVGRVPIRHQSNRKS